MTPLGVILVTHKCVTPLPESGVTTLVVMVKLVTRKRVTPKIRAAGIVFLFFCFLVAIFYLLFKSDFLIIKNVNCWVQDKTSLADEKRWCEEAERLLLEKRMVYSNLTTVVVSLEHKFLPVGEVVVKKKYPQTVLVQISERKPLAKVCQLSGWEFLVDKEGVIFSEITPETEDLKKVILELGLELTLGQTLNKDVVFLIILEDPQIKSIKYIGQEGMEVQTEENLVVLFSRQKNLENQVRSLQMIVKKYRIEGKGLKSVDLRYDQPVVRY